MAKKRIPKINVGEFPYVNIMPQSRLAAIESGVAKAKWIKIIGVGVAFAAVVCLGSVGFGIVAQINQDSAISAQADVEKTIKSNAIVDSALTIRDSLTKDILRSSASTIKWQDLESRVRTNLPGDSELVSFQAVTGGTEKGKTAVAVLVSIASTQPIEYSKVLKSFSNISGLVDGSLQIGNLSAQGNLLSNDLKYVYPVAFSVDSSISANLFDYLKDPSKAPKPSAKTSNTPMATTSPAPSDGSQNSANATTGATN